MVLCTRKSFKERNRVLFRKEVVGMRLSKVKGRAAALLWRLRSDSKGSIIIQRALLCALVVTVAVGVLGVIGTRIANKLQLINIS